MFVTAGSDMYGRVKSVGGTPIVTKFAMLQFLPVFPQKSYYFLGNGEARHSGVPLLASSSSTEFEAIPLRRTDLLSVLMTYVRAVLALLLIVGFLGTTIAVTVTLSGERMDESQKLFLQVAAGMLGTAIVVGVLTYVVPLTSPRERRIRGLCGHLLGVCVDPARVPSGIASEMEAAATDAADGKRQQLIARLVGVRAKIARGANRRAMEEKTSEILERLDGGGERKPRSTEKRAGTSSRRPRRSRTD